MPNCSPVSARRSKADGIHQATAKAKGQVETASNHNQKSGTNANPSIMIIYSNDLKSFFMVQKYKKRMRLYHGAPSFFILNLYFLLDKNSIP